MGKRFRETNISREAWYRKLTPEFKCAWNFICDECDVAGVWAIDDDAMSFYIGRQIDLKAFFDAVNQDKIRVEFLDSTKIFIPGFVEFQYGELSEFCKPHKKIISLLKKYNLYERVSHRVYDRVSDTLQEKEKEEEKEKEKEEEVPEMKFPIERCLQIAMMDPKWKKENKPTEIEISEFMTMLTGTGEHEKNPADFKRHFYHWKKKLKANNSTPSDTKLTLQELREMEYWEKNRKLNAQ